MKRPFYRNEENMWFRDSEGVYCYRITKKKLFKVRIVEESGIYGVMLATTTSLFGLNAITYKIPIFLLFPFIIITVIIAIRITSILILKKTFTALKEVNLKTIPEEAKMTRKKMILLLSICITVTIIAMLIFISFESIRFDSGLMFTLFFYMTGVLYDTYDFRKIQPEV